MAYDFSEFDKVNITGINIKSLSGDEQSVYFSDIAKGRLKYFTIDIADPEMKVSGDTASITFTSVLYANAYGARGTYHMKGT